MLLAPTPVWAENYPINFGNGAIDLGGEPTQSEIPEIPIEEVPGSEEYFVLNSSAFQVSTGNLSAQDTNNSVANLGYVVSSTPPALGGILIQDQEGKTLYDSKDNTDRFKVSGADGIFSYKLMTSLSTVGNSWDFKLNRELTHIQLTQQQGLGVKVFGGSANVNSSELADLDVAIGGTGNVHFAFTDQQAVGGDVEMGYLYLTTDSAILADNVEGEDASTYTGKTYVGNVDGSGKDITVVFGKNNAFGQTSNLEVHSDSSVWFADKDQNQGHTQTVGGLTGSGQLNLGSAAKLTLDQNSTQNGYADIDTHTVRIANSFTGSGNAVFNVDLSDLKTGQEDPVYEVFFTDKPVDNEFTGLITLTGAALTAHNDTYSQTIGKDTYENLNSILLGATLQVKEGGLLKVDTTGEVNDLIFDQGSRIEFGGLGNNAKNGVLTVNGDLTLNSDTEISIKDFDYDFVKEAEGTTLIAADEGLTNHLIEIAGDLNANNHKFTLDQDTLNKAEPSEIKQGNTTVAYGTWAFDSDLHFNEAKKTFDLVYSLTDVAIVDGQTLRLDGKKGATTTQDFTALITDHEDGAGNLLLAAGEGATGNGTIIEIGNAETEKRNSYSGTTTVAEGTTAVLVEDSAFGDTSKLTALGDVILNKNVAQTVHAIDGSGNGTITLNQGAVLTVDATESQTINNLFSGTGSLVVDLGSSNNSLIFGNTRDDSFTGQLTLTNGLFSLDQTGNATLASNVGITLGAGSVFDFGSQQSTIKDLTVNADSSIKSSALVIGSKDVPHQIDGTLTLNGDVTLTLDDISVATDLALINYDQGLVGQNFITAGNLAGEGSFTLEGSGEFSNLSQVTLDYQQTQNGEVSTVAETVWSIAEGLNKDGTAFQAEAQLKEIHLIDDLLIIGTGTDNTLTALLRDSTQGSSHSITFSNGTFTVANEGNNYSGQTSVNNGANVTLATSNAFGQTSTLKVDGTVVLDKQVQQAIGGLSGSGTITLNDGSVLSLSQNQDLTVSNLLTGNGTFDVTLGGVGNKLLFSNESATAFGGTIGLTSGSVTLEESNNVTQKVLQSSALVLNNAGLLNVDGSNGQRTLGSLTLNEGSSLVFSSIEMGSDAAETAQLSVTGDVTAAGSSTITLDGVNLSGTLNILTADDLNGGLKQALVTAGGTLSGVENLQLVTDDIPTSQISNTPEGETVAYGVWTGAGTGGSAFDVDGQTLYATLRLNEIQLAAADGTGLLLALDDKTSNQELSAKLTNYENVAGDITYSGAGKVTVSNTKNDYTGGTYVKEGAKVVLGGNNVLGQTALLQVTGNGSQVNLNGREQSIGQLDLDVEGALTGAGKITLTGNNLQSTIDDANDDLSANITLENGHELFVNDVASIGKEGSLTLNEGTQFTLSGATTGTLSKQLTGAGSVNIVNSTIALDANNSSFTGAWALSTQNAGSTSVSIEGTSDKIDNALGTGATVQLGEGAQLSLALTGGETLSIDETLTGSGLLAVSGANTQSFGFESAWQTPANFEGTLSLTGIGMTVGGQGGSLGANNAANLVNADLELNNGSILTVVGGVVDTFGTVTANAGGFNLGVMGFSTPNADEPEGTVQLNIDQLIVSGGANTTIGVALPDTNRGDIAGSVDQGSLLGNGQTPFQTLIATGSAISENTLSQLKLAEKGGVNQVSQGIFNADNEVAKGYYDFALGLSGDKTDVGILYKLTQVDILNSQTLTLSEKGTLTATLTSSGIGNLSIAEGGAVTLTAENTFTGNTTIDSGASLTANEGSLGNTQLLNVKGSFVNAGANTVDQLEATGDLTLNAALNLDHADEQTESAISAALHGKGDLSVNQGVLSIDENEKTNENEETKFAGNILLGVNGGTNAQLNLAGASGLGSGSVTFNTTGSVFSLTDSESVLFSNVLKGQGVIKVNLGAADHTFAFGSTQDALEKGTLLSLTNAVFDLTADAENYNDEVAQKLIVELNAGSTLSNSGVADKTLAGLTLDGGNVDLGGLNVDVGQINLSGGALTINSETTIALDSTAQTTESGNRELTATGESLLTGSSGSGGLFDLNIFEGVGKLIGALGDTNSEGDQQVTQLTTGKDFGQTIESLYQDADGDRTIATNEHVANMTRADGKFYYDDEGDSVYLQYTFKEIELLWTQENQGLTVNNTSSDGSHLSATLTGVGNILLGGPITVSGRGNDYTGRTYILDDANITLATNNNALGRTSMLEVGEGASVTLNDNLMQTVGGLAGSGALALGSGSAFTIDNSWGAQSQIAIGNTIQGTTGATGVNFTIDGAYGDNDANKADLIFTKQSNLNGISLTLSNINFAINGEADLNYLTTSSADDLVIGSGATTTIAALESGSYEFNELSFAGNGGLNVTGVTLSSEGTDAVIHTDVLDLNDKGTLSVSANIADGFDILVNDSDTYTSTLIAYDRLSGNRDNLQTSPNLGESAINQDNKVVAYVGWTGDILWNPEEGTGSGTVGMSYSVANVQLAADDDEGLVLSTENTGDEEESTLTALVTDYEEDGTVVHGDITFDGGNITIGGQAPNTYHGNTYVNKGTVTLAKNAGFGETALLQIADGAKVDLGSYDQTVGSLVAAGTDALSGTGTLTLGTTGSQTSDIKGTNQFAGTVVLNTDHVLTLNDGAGLGSGATLEFSDATGKLVLSGAQEDAFETKLSGTGTVTLSGSTDITLAGSNENFTGTWILNKSTAKVNGTTSLTVDQILGTNATITLTGAEDALSLSQAGIDQWAIDDAFTGQGQLTLTGYAGQSFGFSREWTGTGAFEGTLSVNNLTMTVGGSAGTEGIYNAANLASANFNLNNGSTLIVATQDTVVDTFNTLTVDGGTIQFNGKFGLEASPTQLGQLQVGALNGSGNISLELPESNDSVAQTIAQNDLLSIDGKSLFQALITANEGQEVSVDGWTLNGDAVTTLSGLRQDVMDGNELVAQALYDYELTAKQNALGIGYELTRIDIQSGKTLTLTEQGELSAVVTDLNGQGSLLITDNGNVTLSGKNVYSGTTTVDGASLTADASGLGNTSGLTLTDANFTNAGANTANVLSSTNSTINLNNTLELSGSSQITGGTVNGAGSLNVLGSLQVSGVVAGNYSGTIELGTDQQAGNLTLKGGAAGLGKGIIDLANSQSQVTVTGNDDLTLTNTYVGNGSISVNLGSTDHVFAFNSNQATEGGGLFTGSLALTDSTYHLYEDGGKLSGATLETQDGSNIIVNTADNTGDRTVGGLTLAGGTLNFGTLLGGTTDGQIVVGDKRFSNTALTTINVALGTLTDDIGSGVFGSDAGVSVSLIEGFDASSQATLNNLKLNDGSGALSQVIAQDGRNVAEFGYTGGKLVGTGTGIEAQWKLSTITLTDTEKGFAIDATGQTNNAGEVTAQITGSGKLEIAGGTVTLNNTHDTQNDYTGQTLISGNSTLILGSNEALGDTNDLLIKEGTTDFRSTAQTIDAMHVAENGHFTMSGDGSLTLGAGDSVIESANTGAVSGSITLANNGTTLELQNADAIGGLTLTAGDDTSVTLNFGEESAFGVLDNLLRGAGIYYVGDVEGEDAAYVQLTNTGNSFSQIVVNKLGHLFVEDMDAEKTALNNANLTVAAGGEATLNGGAAWTLTNTLNVKEGGALAISAGGAKKAFNFQGTNQSVSGTLLLTDALLTLGGQTGSNGAANADVLANATLNAGEGSAVHIATGDNAQNLAALALNGGDLYFDGTLGVNVSTATLGQLSVESLSLVGGTLHATASTSQGSGGNITNDTVISAQANNLFQNLISITGSDGVTEEDLNKIELNVTDQNGDEVPGVSSDIVQGNETVATGTYGYELALEDSDGKSLGVSYTLREIDLLKTLSIVENGNMTARLTGAGNLVVAQESALTLTDRKSDDSADWNDFTGATTVEGSLKAGAMTLGSDNKHTSLLSVAEGGSFTNAGANVIGNLKLKSQGSVVLEEGTTLTVKGDVADDKNVIDGTLSGSGDLILESGNTTVASGQSGYSGDITLGSDEAASLVLNGHTSLGSGTITFKDSDSELSITDLTTSGSLTNLLSGAGKITVTTGNGNNATFAFNASQTADGLSGSSVSLSGVNYDFTRAGSDVLGQATLSLTDGTLTVNAGQSSSDRLVAGLTLKNVTVDFGTMGPDVGGVIDLQGNVLDAIGTTVTFDANLAAVTGDNGAAAMVNADAVTLVTNVQGDRTSGLTVSVGEGDTVNQYAQAIYQDGSSDPVAYIRGSIDNKVSAQLDESDSLYDFVASLTNHTLEIVSEYVVSTSGDIGLAITDLFNEDDPTTAGSLTISDEGTVVTLTHTENTYHGVTSVESGATLKLAKDNVLGNTSELSIAAGSTVDFGSSSQTVGALNSGGQMISGDTGKLTVTNGGTVSGANSDFHLEVALDGSTDLTLKDADALGDGSVTISQTGTYLVLSGITGTDGAAAEYDNAVSGLGGIKLSDNANVVLTESNTFSGDLIVGKGSTVSALGDVFSHLGEGELVLSGNADFTLTDTTATGVWTWDKTVTKSGVLALNRDQSVQSTELVFTDASIDDFSGTISLKNWDITLDADGTGNTYTALKGSGANLTIGQGADATINGVVDLAGKTVAVDASGSLTFTGVAAPGSDNTELSKLTADILDLNDGFIINLDVDENQTVNAGALLTQDDAEGTTITVATATNHIEATVEDGVLTGGDVTVNGSAVAEDDTIRFNIAQTSTDSSKGGIVAEGIYGVSVTTDNKNLNVSYALEGVSINADKTLVFAGQDSDADNSANIFNGYIIGEGNLEISSNVVTLAGQNSFTGSTAVLGGAILYAKEGALGNADNSTLNLAIENTGKVYIDGDNVVRGIDNHGLLVVGSWNTHEPTPDITLTLQSDESAGSVIDGSLEGTGTLRVVGNGSVDNVNLPDLKIVGSQSDFYGSLELDDGAWVELEANSNLIFGNISQYATNEISLSKNSLLTINSLLEDNANFAAVFVNGDSEDGTGESRGGRIDVTLGDADSQFKFASGQASAGFNGVFALNQGKLDLGDLYWEANVTGNALEEATLVLGSMGSAQLGLNGEASTTDSFLGGLEFNGGKLAIGSLSYDAESGSSGAGVHSMHVNLGGDGLLGLTTITGEGKSTITIEQNEVNTISADGSELLAAADGAYITLIHNIGGLVVDGTKVENIGDYLDELSNDLLMLDNQTQAKQVLAQRIDGFDDPQKVAEVVRTFDQSLTLGESTISGEDGKYALTVGYTVNQIGLLFETGSVSGLDDTSVWQGLNIVTSSDVERNNYQANIVDGSTQQGNIVFRGDGQNTLTLSGDNTYHGKTWVTDNAQVAFGAEHAFGSTQALRIDENSSVNFGRYSQTIGSIWALGSNALVADSGSVLTINGGLISGANTGLAASVNITGDLTIKDAFSLGSGLVTLGNADSHLRVNGVNGTLTNTFAGVSGANISLDGNSSVTLNSGAIDDYEGGLSVAEGSSLALTLTAEDADSNIAFGNRLDVGGSLSVSTTHGGAFHFANAGSSITGGLEVHNAHFDLSDENNLNVLQGVDLTVGNSGVVNVSTSVGTDHLTGLTLNDGSTLVFENGATPGTAGGDELAHIDLDKGSLNANGHVTVAVNVDKVNADWVQTAGNTTNLPLTAQDVLSASGEGQILANLVSAGTVNKEDVSFDVEVNVADNGSYADEKLTVDIFNNTSDQKTVAQGIYDYKITLDDDGLNLAYGLSEVKLIDELVLNGYGDDTVSDDVLSITISGDGDLRIGSGAITLTGENSYEGATTVAAGATLKTGQSGSALGQTSLLDLEGASSQAYIKGKETVRGLNVASGARLALENTATLTIDSSDTGTQSVIDGTLTGSDGTTLAVIGGGDSGTPDLIVNTANEGFLGDTSLKNAHVLLTNLEGLGAIRGDEDNPIVNTITLLDQSSVLEVSSVEANGSLIVEGEQHDLHRLTNLIKGDGTVLVSLADSEDYFDFAEAQYDYVDAENQNFKGTFELQSGIFKFNEDNADVLNSVAVVLDGDATFDLSVSGNTKDRTMKALTLSGGTLKFGSLAMDSENAEANGSHVNLNDGNLVLDDSQRKVEIAFEANATNTISSDGSEIVSAAGVAGSKVVLIHDIGHLYLVDNGIQTELLTSDENQEVLNDYLEHALADESSEQLIQQSIGTKANGEQDLQSVAQVNREFGSFGYADLASVGLDNALYVNYKIDSIDLLYSGSSDSVYGEDGSWKGLTVSSSGTYNELTAKLTGNGNLVITNGDKDPLKIGYSEGNEYSGRTWVTNGASVEFVADQAFGNTSQLRIDDGATVNLVGFDQTVGSLLAYGDNALQGTADSVITVTGSSTINGTNDEFKGAFVFDSSDKMTGTVTDVNGLGASSVSIGENYTLVIADTTFEEGAETIAIDNTIKDVNGKGGVLQIGQTGLQGQLPIELAGNNSGFSGDITVSDNWSLVANVTDNGSIADRLGTGNLAINQYGEAQINFTDDVSWNHSVTGSGNLVISTQSSNKVGIDSGLGDTFTGTLTVGGGTFDLAQNADKLGAGQLAAEGEKTRIVVSSDQTVSFDKNLTVSDGASLVFGDTVNLSEEPQPELNVGGTLTLNGAQVKVTIDGELDVGNAPSEALDMSALTMADEADLSYVIAQADVVDLAGHKLWINGSTEYNPMSVDITDGTHTIAQGKYDFDLGVSTDRTELGLSYHLKEVAINDGETLALAGAIQGETAAVDWANASEFSAAITGDGGIGLVEGNLTLSGSGNSYTGDTVIGGADGSAVLTVESSLGNTSHVVVNQTGKLVNVSDETQAGYLTVDGGEVELQSGSALSILGQKDSVVDGTLTGSGALTLRAGDFKVVSDGDYRYSGKVTVGDGASFTLSTRSAQTVSVTNSFAANEGSAGTVAFNGSGSTYQLLGSAVELTGGTFLLGDNVTVEADNINAIGGAGSELLITTADDTQATFAFDYDESKSDKFLKVTQQMTEGITFAKSGTGVVHLSDKSLGAGAVDVSEGGLIFGEIGSKTQYATNLAVEEDAWAAGFGGVATLSVDSDGAFYVGGRSGYNSLTEAADNDGSKTVTFTVGSEGHTGTALTNSGTIYVGNKTDVGQAPSDADLIGNELVINGDYVTSTDGHGGILDMNALIAGNDGSKADHVTITGGIIGQGYIDVNYDATASTGGKLDYLGLVSVGEGEDPDNLSLKLKDSIKINDLYYALMYSTEQNEYYLMSSVTDPGDDPWKTEEVENVQGASRSALAFVQSQTFDLSLHDHVGETLYVDPITGEERSTSFWMIQRGDWTKFSNASGQIDSDGHVYTTHLGGDVITHRTDNATYRVGIVGSFADGKFDMKSNVNGKSAEGQFRGYSAGLYMTAQSDAESGPYAGLQVRWNRFSNEIGADDYHVDGLSVTAEAGVDMLLSKGTTETGRSVEWRVEPHVRAHWTDFGNPDTWTSEAGETVSSSFDNGMLFRVGARTKVASMKGAGPAVQAYAEANWVYNYGDYKTTVSTKYGDVKSTQSPTNFGELRLGFETQFTPNVNVWFEGHHHTGSNDYKSSGAMVGFKYQW